MFERCSTEAKGPGSGSVEPSTTYRAVRLNASEVRLRFLQGTLGDGLQFLLGKGLECLGHILCIATTYDMTHDGRDATQRAPPPAPSPPPSSQPPAPPRGWATQASTRRGSSPRSPAFGPVPSSQLSRRSRARAVTQYIQHGIRTTLNKKTCLAFCWSFFLFLNLRSCQPP